MELDIIIEKIDNIKIPTDSSNNCFQFRSDGILLNRKLHIWEEILFVSIVNRELLKKLKKENKTYICPVCGQPYASSEGNTKCINCLDKEQK